MKKVHVCFALCAVAVTGFGTETYDATTGYVTFKGGWVKGFASEAGWSDGLAPHSGTNYYIGAGNSLSADSSAQNKTFQGDRLVVAGSVFHGVSGDYTVGWCPVEFLSGAEYVFYSVGGISTEAAWTVSATEEKPFRMRYSRAGETSAYRVAFPQTFVSDADGYMILERRADHDESAMYGIFSLTGDWSEYRGTFEVSCRNVLRRSAAWDCPGTIVLRDYGTRLELSGSETVSTVGTLDLGSGTVLSLCSLQQIANRGNVVSVSDRLVIAEGAEIWHGEKTLVSTNQPARVQIFRLSKKAYDAGLPDFTKVRFVSRNSASETLGPLPRSMVDVVGTDDGGAEVYLTWKPIVEHMVQNGAGSSSLVETGDPSKAWTDGKYPGPGSDYLCRHYLGKTYAMLHFRGLESPYTFKGDSLVFTERWAPMVLTTKDVTVNDLWVDGGYIRPFANYGESFVLRGGLSISSGKTAQIQLGDGVTFTLASDLKGAGTLKSAFGGEQMNNAKCRRATLWLTGDNSGFSGKIEIMMPENPSDKIGSFAAGPSSNITVQVSDGQALGGALPGFTADAFKLYRHCRLDVTDDAVFAEKTRGWSLPDNACIRVGEGKTAVVSNDITYTSASHIVKEGDGALRICGAALSAAGGALLEIAGGCLMTGSAEALEGVDVRFGAGTGTRTDGSDVALDVSKAASLVCADGALRIDVDMAGWVLSSEKFTVPVLRTAASSAAAYVQNGGIAVRLLNRPAGYCVRGLAVTGTDADTVSALIGHVGFSIIMR